MTITRFLLATVLLVLVGCGGIQPPKGSGSPAVVPETPATFTGEITEIETSEAGQVRILVHGNRSEADLVWFTLTKNAQVFTALKDPIQTAKPADLQVGQQVRIGYNGAIRESLPAQADADVVVIIGSAGAALDDLPAGPAVYEGTITELDTSGRLRILVQGDTPAGGNDLVWFTLSDQGRVFVERLEGKRSIAYGSDLSVGQKVRIDFSGVVAESYPGQATADSILIKRP